MITYSFNGRLTQDAELRTLASGTPVLKMCVACNRPNKETKFFHCDLYGKIADSLRPYLTKGKEVSVLGSPDWNKTEDGKVFENIKAYDVTLLGNTEQTNQQEPMQFGSSKSFDPKDAEIPFIEDDTFSKANAEFDRALKEEFGVSDCPF